ncbi:MAG: hypothetical protein U1F18_08275 [Steroidobacteraceae bacterium]
MFAAVAHAPSFGAKVKSFDDTAARAVKGVVDVKQVASGIAVYGEHTQAALKGRDALKVEWDLAGAVQALERGAHGLSAATQDRQARAGLKDVGNVDTALKAAAKGFDVEYSFPYLAHACMGPMNATAQVRDGQCEMWAEHAGQSRGRADGRAGARTAAGLGQDQHGVPRRRLRPAREHRDRIS